MDIRKMTMEQIEGLVSQAQQGELQRGQLRITLQAFQRDITTAKKALDNMERSAAELLKSFQAAGSTRPTPTVGSVTPVSPPPPPTPASPPPPPRPQVQSTPTIPINDIDEVDLEDIKGGSK
jgi:hypothetical protein